MYNEPCNDNEPAKIILNKNILCMSWVYFILPSSLFLLININLAANSTPHTINDIRNVDDNDNVL